MYLELAQYYDGLMLDAEYEKRADYLIGLFLTYGKKPKLLLDAACGTGTLSILLSQKGIEEVIGVDVSENMLAVANEKAKDKGQNVLFLNQDLEDLDLYGTVDGAICTLDSVNHITSKAKLLKIFKRISLFMEKDSLFIFDVNTVYKHKYVLGNNTFVFDNDDVFCCWQNFYHEKSKRVDICLDFFGSLDGVYNRKSEYFTEKAYTDAELKEIIKKAGFSMVEIFADMSNNKPGPKCQRKVFVVKKV